MFRVYRGKDWIIREKPSGVFIREKLSNGQYVSMWLWRQRYKDPNKQIIYIWKIGLYIGSKKGAALWRRSNTKTKQTGECGLEGLKVALDYIKHFTNGMGYKEELQINHEDMKRHRAYKFLLHYPGFTEYKFDNEKDNCIAFRIPDYWEWHPAEKGEGIG